jgi:hypothetical protein
LFDNLQTVAGLAPSVAASSVSAAASDLLYICGRISPEGKFDQLAPAYTLTPGMVGEKTLAAFATFQKEYTFQNASFSLDLVNGDGTTLLSQPFEPFPAETHDEEATSRVFFLTLPALPKTANIVVNFKGQPIGAIKVSPNAPVVKVISPNGGEKIENELVVQWSADDADGGDLFFTVQYSRNKGANWQALAHNIQGKEFRQSIENLPGGIDCMVRVIEHPPLAFLNAPLDGTIVRAGELLTLSGTGFDLEQDEITEDQFIWTVDSVFAGTGSELIYPGLDPGLHQVTLTVTDSSKTSSSTTVSLRSVIAGESPRLQIDLVKTGFQLSWPASAQGFTLESAEQLSSATQWTPVKDPPTLEGDTYKLVIPNGGKTRFYRLAGGL